MIKNKKYSNSYMDFDNPVKVDSIYKCIECNIEFKIKYEHNTSKVILPQCPSCHKRGDNVELVRYVRSEVEG